MLRNWFTQFWGLAGPKSVGPAGELETQEKSDAAV